ncbi:MAG: hypothetical protein IGQ45_03960 [Cyanobacterium sp. T60_A2020_053]|nr:hypothetical protein [Cyanobacterium sp. T60_A2020_053]
MTNNEKTEIDELKKQIHELHSLLSNLETYVKVTGVQNYQKVINYNINYSKISYLQKNHKLREKLNDDCVLMIKARLNDDFTEFCRLCCLQIELVVDHFIRFYSHKNLIDLEQTPNNTIKSITVIATGEKYKKESYEFLPLSDKVEFCCNMIMNKSNEEKITKIKQIINRLIKNERNKGSHRDAFDIPFI